MIENIEKLKDLPNLVVNVKPGKACFFLRICPLSDDCIGASKDNQYRGIKWQCDIKALKEMYKIESNPF